MPYLKYTTGYILNIGLLLQRRFNSRPTLVCNVLTLHMKEKRNGTKPFFSSSQSVLSLLLIQSCDSLGDFTDKLFRCRDEHHRRH